MTPETLLTPIIEYGVQHPEQVAALVTGLGASAATYVRTGKLPIGRLPYRAAREVLGDVRAKHFGKRRPRGVPAIVVDAAPTDVEDALRAEHFEDTDFDYKYSGEAWSLRRPDGQKAHPETGAPVPLELHPRGFETTDGRTLLVTHLEASRYEAMRDHYQGTLLSWPEGRDRIAVVLDDAGVDYQLIESERAADVEVI